MFKCREYRFFSGNKHSVWEWKRLHVAEPPYEVPGEEEWNQQHDLNEITCTCKIVLLLARSRAAGLAQMDQTDTAIPLTTTTNLKHLSEWVS
jgi:hypothetical protein